MELLRVNGKNDYRPRTPSSKLMFNKCLFLMVFFCFTAVRGQWTPLVELVEPCGFTLDGQDGELNIAAPLVTCGIAVMVNFRESLVMTRFPRQLLSFREESEMFNISDFRSF